MDEPLNRDLPSEPFFERSTHAEFASRVGARGVISGVLVSYAALMLLMTLCGAVGLWDFSLTDIPGSGAGFYIWAFASWVVSLYCGGLVAGIASRPQSVRDGVINGVVTWAGCCVVGAVIFSFLARPFFTDLYVPQAGYGWGAFVGDIVGLIFAMAGGASGFRAQGRIREPRMDRGYPEGRVAEYRNIRRVG